jgi:hypothetical protein
MVLGQPSIKFIDATGRIAPSIELQLFFIT